MFWYLAEGIKEQNGFNVSPDTKSLEHQYIDQGQKQLYIKQEDNVAKSVLAGESDKDW